jgi:hydroxymethylbilane synthase
MNKIIRIGTNGNSLAIAQARYIEGLIKPSGYQTEIISSDVSTDDKTKAKKNLEAKLLDGSIDIAIHHAKDVPADLHEELELIAFTKRDHPNDVIVSHIKNINLKTENRKVGTSSIRRMAFVKHFYANVQPIFVSGDPESQIKKMKAGEFDALLLAFADVHRLGFDDLIVENIETSYFVPAVGQGSLVVECHKKLSFDKKDVIQRWVNDEETEDCIRTERAFAKTLSNQFNIASFGYAQFEGNLITLKAGLISLDGKQVIKTKRSSTVAESKELGKKVAMEVLINGGNKILQEISAH